MNTRHSTCAALVILHFLSVSAWAQSTQPAPAEALQFEITFDQRLQSTPYTGRVYVVLSTRAGREPRHEIMNWFNMPQIFSVDVKGSQPGQAIRLADAALAFPSPLQELKTRQYTVQAIARRSLDHPVPGQGPGDLYSDPQTLSLDPTASGIVRLNLSNVVTERPFEETERIKYVELESALLSKFHGRPMKLRAGVVLPKSWTAEPKRRYPVLYWIGGFGGDHHFANRLPKMSRRLGAGEKDYEVLQVVPDPTCYRGHNVFADSANNGPWGRALVEELIPHVEKRFRGAQSGEHRYVTGISSGGWSSLWLQIAYPKTFNGCWSHVPDSVDFRDFQKIDLYAVGSNVFVDEAGKKRAVARMGGDRVLEYEAFIRMEEVLGPGGQIHSFEAVFSPRGPDGLPRLLFDRATGVIDLEVAKTWERYDIRLILERNWARLEPELRGKLHIYAGEKDTFFLEGAVVKLKESLAKLGSDAEVIIVPAMAHAFYRDKVKPMYEQIVGHFSSDN